MASMFSKPKKPPAPWSVSGMGSLDLPAPPAMPLSALPQVPQIQIPQFSPPANIPAPPQANNNDLLLKLLSQYQVG